jgi:hypothetical protein
VCEGAGVAIESALECVTEGKCTEQHRKHTKEPSNIPAKNNDEHANDSHKDMIGDGLNSFDAGDGESEPATALDAV